MSNTFSKSERIAGRKNFELLIAGGQEFFAHPFRIVWQNVPEPLPYPAQIAFGVSKRNFKKAVDRNRVKRLLRESYRRHKHPFYDSLSKQGKQIRALLIYTPKTIPLLAETDTKIILTLRRLIKESDGTGSKKRTA
jgi:ribonuclease P protein component